MFHPMTTASSVTPSVTTPTRSFEWYRYAIEVGLITPHHERCYVPAWEQPKFAQSTPPSAVTSRGRAGKRYHTPSSDDDYEDYDCSMMTDEHSAPVR